MKTTNFFGTIILAAVMATTISCSEGNDGPTIQPPMPAMFRQVLNNAFNDILQSGTFTAEDGINFISEAGVTFTIDPGCIFKDGLPVSGTVNFEFAELYKRGNMMVVNKPLMGTDVGGDKGPMITGGQFYLKLTQDGEQLTTACFPGYSMVVPVSLTGETPDPDMTFWTGTEDEDGNMLWNDEGRGQEENWLFGEGANYNLFGYYFGWINIDILWNLPDPKCPIWIKPPHGYNHKNSSVYVVYKDQPGSLAYMDVWDTDKEMFTEHYGLAPEGMNFYVIFMSVLDDGRYVYSYKDVTVENNQIISFEISDLKIMAKDALIALINNLQ
ncbi:MAG: hypothetical protein FWH23_08045 [Bacteroidales bacterium]|nr:hypothetical protein [Bacteroidales bacterium]